MSALVYYIQAARGGPVKIGHAKNPARRLVDLQIANAYPLVIRHAVQCESVSEARKLERRLHEYYAPMRLRGEWFLPTSEMVRLGVLGDADDPDPEPTARGKTARAFRAGKETGWRDAIATLCGDSEW